MRNDQPLMESERMSLEIERLQDKQKEAKTKERQDVYSLIRKYTQEVFNFSTLTQLLRWMIHNSIEKMTFYTSYTASTSLEVMINSTLGYSLMDKCYEKREFNGYYYVQYGGKHWAISEVKTPDVDGKFISIIEINIESL